MKDKWLNLVLHLTNRIYNRKQKIVEKEGLGAIANIIVLIVMEIALGFVSLPLYLGMKSENVSAFLQEKGGYAKVNFDYNLRRVLTLTGVGIVFLIWEIKLLLILLIPTIYGPLKLYKVSELRPPDLLSIDSQLVAESTEIQGAKIVPSMKRPEIKEIHKEKGGDYTFSGIGQPLSTVVLLLSDAQTAIYSNTVDSSGNWKIHHFQKDFKLSQGNHSVLAYCYDKSTNSRSDVSTDQYFKVKTTLAEKLIKNVDVLANWSVVLILLLGVFLTFLTI